MLMDSMVRYRDRTNTLLSIRLLRTTSKNIWNGRLSVVRLVSRSSMVRRLHLISSPRRSKAVWRLSAGRMPTSVMCEVMLDIVLPVQYAVVMVVLVLGWEGEELCKAMNSCSCLFAPLRNVSRQDDSQNR